MADQPSVKIDKSMPYRGGTRVWSNRWHFTGGSPSDNTHWLALFDAITAAEKLIYKSTTSIVNATGYDAGSDVPVASKAYSLAGTASLNVNDFELPGQTAAIWKFTTDQRTAKNHPIYLFKYFHSIFMNTSQAVDQLADDQRLLIATYCNVWVGAGFSDGTVSHKYCGPRGAAGITALNPVIHYVSHRDFPR